jgi:hypothetical protein
VTVLPAKHVAGPSENRKLELRYQLYFRLIELVSKAADQIIPGVVAVLIVYFGIYRTAHELAGKNTLASLGIGLLSDAKPDEIISYAAAIVGWIFGVTAQRLRRNTTERLTTRIQELEKQIDPNRTSSGLTRRGETPPEAR